MHWNFSSTSLADKEEMLYLLETHIKCILRTQELLSTVASYPCMYVPIHQTSKENCQMESHHVLWTHDPLASVSLSAEMTGISHHSQPSKRRNSNVKLSTPSAA